MVSSRSDSGRRVTALASYGVERFLTGRTDEASLRSLGVLIADESAGWTLAQPDGRAIPPMVELMIDYIVENLDRQVTLAEIATAGGCSVTTAERQFARYAGVSVVTWMRRRRMQEAALLLRTSGFRVNEVARRVGYPDPLYFSRVFTAVHGVPPSRYWNDQLRP
jgi:AraC-like DNA-binding protein